MKRMLRKTREMKGSSPESEVLNIPGSEGIKQPRDSISLNIRPPPVVHGTVTGEVDLSEPETPTPQAELYPAQQVFVPDATASKYLGYLVHSAQGQIPVAHVEDYDAPGYKTHRQHFSPHLTPLTQVQHVTNYRLK